MDTFRLIYERYQRDVYRFALFLTGNTALAEDLAADQTLLQERNRHPDTEAAREREMFDRARAGAALRLKTRAGAAAWALAAAFSWFMAFITWNDRLGFRNPGVILGVMFLSGAILTFGLSFVVTPESRWRDLAGLDDETLKSL